MAYKKCRQCGAENLSDESVCKQCGADLSGVPEHATFCSEYAFSRLTPRGKQICERAFEGDAEAMCEYGLMLYGGEEGSSDDLEGAYEWFLCAARGGCAEGFFRAGSMQCNGDLIWEEDGGSFKEGVRLLKAGARMGSGRCMFALGQYYLKGRGVKQSDRLAFEYLYGAVSAGIKDAMILAAQQHLQGAHGFSHDLARAEELYTRAGALHTMYRDFRHAYATGEGLPQDDAKAEEMGEKYLKELLRLYDADPQTDVTCGYAWQLGEEYMFRGDEETAVAWYRKAMEHGDVMGKMQLKLLKKL